MTITINKKEPAHTKARKLAKATAKSKSINWDKYFGKIKFPMNALAYQQKIRNEWGK
jgi:hypothetical protein